MNVSDWIQVIGIAVTGLFSYFVWKATQKQADATDETANLTAATLELTKQLAQRDEQKVSEIHSKIKKQLTVIIIADTEEAYKKITGLSREEIFNKLSQGTGKLRVGIKDIAEYFTTEEYDAIMDGWNSYNEYLRKYLRPFYPSNDGASMDDLYNRTDTVGLKFNKVINMLRNSN